MRSPWRRAGCLREPSTGSSGVSAELESSCLYKDWPLAEKSDLGRLGGPAIFPVADVVGVQAAGGPTAGHRAHGVAVLEGAAKPAADHPGGAASADDLPMTFEPDFAGGITGQVLAFGVR